jgi:hypothetical protein
MYSGMWSCMNVARHSSGVRPEVTHKDSSGRAKDSGSKQARAV